MGASHPLLATDAIPVRYRLRSLLPTRAPTCKTEQACRQWIARFLAHHEKRRDMPRLLGGLSGLPKLLVQVLHETGLGVGEVLQLRVRDVDLAQSAVTGSDGGSRVGRLIPVSEALGSKLRMQLLLVRCQHRRDLEHGHGEVPLPPGVATFDPAGAWDPDWQFLFPATTLSRSPHGGAMQRLPIRAASLRKALRGKVQVACLQTTGDSHGFL